DHFGISIKNDNYQKYMIKPQKYRTVGYTVEADYSSAAYFYAINYLTGSKIKVENLNPVSKQADKKFADLLKAGLPESIDAKDFPDQAMTLAVLCAFRKNKTVIDGVKSLRIKESERVQAVQNELAKMGIKTESTENTLMVYGGKPRSAVIDTYNDHRIAMSYAVAATKINGMKILNPGVVNKTFPGFWDELSKITKVERSKKTFSNILLIGMRGSGKTTIGKILAEELGKEFIDMDLYLEEKQGKAVRDIVLEHGWEYFRELESEACKQICTKKDYVIASGGGIILDQSNLELFKPNAVTVLFRANPEILSKRISGDENRPGLSTRPTLLGELGDVWKKRKDRYYGNADFIVDTSIDRPVEIAGEVLSRLSPASVKTCLVIGDPIEHSLSPLIHNYGYKLLDIDDEFEYVAEKVTAEELKDFIIRIREENITGVSLTMPHKELVLSILNKLDKTAKQIGAVNTIVNENGNLIGYNTDWQGAVKPLEKLTSLKHKRAAIIGAGGTAKAFVYGLSQAGCEVTVYNRTASKAKELAEKFGCAYAGLDKIGKIKEADIICNTTSVGMDEEKSPIDSSLISPHQIIFDVVYSPLETKLIKDAKAKGAKTIYGIEMLLHQAFEQFKLFTGKDAPEESMREYLLETLNEK
ncbi:MAG TPA: shikimate dehydrogenase, partial [Candidatus Saccharimonadales bacterium]|nr:shikimate dehydrogenase [Candidatus Saccharimonadales bacterium]